MPLRREPRVQPRHRHTLLIKIPERVHARSPALVRRLQCLKCVGEFRRRLVRQVDQTTRDAPAVVTPPSNRHNRPAPGYALGHRARTRTPDARTLPARLEQQHAVLRSQQRTRNPRRAGIKPRLIAELAAHGGRIIGKFGSVSATPQRAMPSRCSPVFRAASGSRS